MYFGVVGNMSVFRVNLCCIIIIFCISTSPQALESDMSQPAGMLEEAVLPHVIRFMRQLQHYLSAVAHCARKTEMAQWEYLFESTGLVTVRLHIFYHLYFQYRCYLKSARKLVLWYAKPSDSGPPG